MLRLLDRAALLDDQAKAEIEIPVRPVDPLDGRIGHVPTHDDVGGAARDQTRELVVVGLDDLDPVRAEAACDCGGDLDVQALTPLVFVDEVHRRSLGLHADAEDAALPDLREHTGRKRPRCRLRRGTCRRLRRGRRRCNGRWRRRDGRGGRERDGRRRRRRFGDLLLLAEERREETRRDQVRPEPDQAGHQEEAHDRPEESDAHVGLRVVSGSHGHLNSRFVLPAAAGADPRRRRAKVRRRCAAPRSTGSSRRGSSPHCRSAPRARSGRS
jgi:hypothetical protein